MFTSKLEKMYSIQYELECYINMTDSSCGKALMREINDLVIELELIEESENL